MGRRAHLLRLALGRSADLPPDWKALENRFHAVSESVELAGDLDNHGKSRAICYRATDAEPGDVVAQLTFDSKGRPVDAAIELEDSKVCEAQNDLLSLAGDVFFAGHEQDDSPTKAMRSISSPSGPMLDEVVTDVSKSCILYESFLSEILCPPLLGWISSLHRRVLLLRSLNECSITDLFINEWHATTPTNFFFSGVPTFFSTNVVVIDNLIEYVVGLPSRYFRDRKTTKMIEQSLSFVLHSSILISFIPLSVVAQLQQLRLNPSARLPPSSSLFKPEYGLLRIIRGFIASVLPAFMIQFIDSQIYEEVNETLSTYLQAYVLKPQNIADDFVVLEGLESLEWYFDGHDARESCFNGRLGAALPRRMYRVISRTCDILTYLLGWNGYRLASNVHSSHTLLQYRPGGKSRGRHRSKVTSDIFSNFPATTAAAQLAHALTYAITIPIEGILIRSFTWLVVEMPWSPFHFSHQLHLQDDIYYVAPRWTEFKRDGIKGTLEYLGKVGFCLGVGTCIRFALTAGVSGYSIWAHKRYRKDHIVAARSPLWRVRVLN